MFRSVIFPISSISMFCCQCVSTPKALADSSCQREGEAKLGEAENRARHMSNMRGSLSKQSITQSKAKSSLIPSLCFTLCLLSLSISLASLIPTFPSIFSSLSSMPHLRCFICPSVIQLKTLCTSARLVISQSALQ